jgi:hypothetical protein
MAIFEYTLPSGSQFRVEAPAGTTQAQADQIFYTQVASGSLIGYEPGQTLTSAETQLTKFELSRLDRGTAGVDTSPVLSINQGIELDGIVVNIASQNLPQNVLASILTLPVPVSIPNLSSILLTNPIDEADIVLIKGDDLPPVAIVDNGTRALSEYQVQKLLAQIANVVDQESDQITVEKGIGQYGFTAYQLEQAGYVKPGTSLKYFSQGNSNFVNIMSSPSIWTGRGGVYSLDSVLEDPALQNKIQTQLMQQSYDELVASGVILTTPTSPVSVGTGQVYTNTGLQSSQTLTSLGLLGTNLESLSPATRSALSNSPALSRLLNLTSVNLNTIGSGATQGLTNLANLNFASVGATLSSQITGSVGALVANASKYGAQATALWAKAGNLQNLNLSSITTNLTNLFPPNLSGLTSKLDILGKAGSFATNFANPLAGLNNVGGLLTAGGGFGGALTGQLGNLQGQLAGQLGNLQGQLAGQLGNLQGQLAGQLGNLQGQLAGQLGNLQGQLGNLGSLTNIGSLRALFGGSGGDLVSGTSVAAGFNNTVNRATVDAAFARTLGSAKIPLPVFQYPSLTAIAPRLDIQQAQNFLKNLQTQGQAIASSAGRLLG